MILKNSSGADGWLERKRMKKKTNSRYLGPLEVSSPSLCLQSCDSWPQPQ